MGSLVCGIHSPSFRGFISFLFSHVSEQRLQFLVFFIPSRENFECGDHHLELKKYIYQVRTIEIYRDLNKSHVWRITQFLKYLFTSLIWKISSIVISVCLKREMHDNYSKMHNELTQKVVHLYQAHRVESFEIFCHNILECNGVFENWVWQTLVNLVRQLISYAVCIFDVIRSK